MSIFSSGNAGFFPSGEPAGNSPIEVNDVAGYDEVAVEEVSAGTRQTSSLYLNNEYYNISGGEHTFFNVFAFNGSHIKIENAKVTVKTQDPVNDVPARFVILGDTSTLQITNSEIRCEWGEFKAYCKNVSITDSSIHVVNKTAKYDYVNEYEARILIRALDPMTIKNSDIHAEAAEGSLDELGGEGTVTLSSSKGLTIMGKKTKGIIAEGGKGGDQSTRGSRAEARIGRQGGEGHMNLEAGGQVVIMDTVVVGQGGIGGSGGTNTALGGKGFFDIDATGHQVTVIRSEIGSKGGLGALSKQSNAGSDESFIKSNTFKVDEPNFRATKAGPLSTVWGYSVTFDVPKLSDTGETCKLYNPYLKSVATTTATTLNAYDADTIIQVFYWLTVVVKDNTGDTIEGAQVTVNDKNNFELDSSTTDSNGKAEFDPIEGLTITSTDQIGKNRLYAKATIYGIYGQTDFYLTESATKEVMLKLLTITVTSVNGLVPKDKMQVGCAVEFKGTVVRPEEAGSVKSVTATVDGKAISPAPTDTSADGSWAEWKLVWNSETVDEGVHKLEFTVSLGSIVESTMLNVTVDQKACNHPPEVLEITGPANNVRISDTEANPYTIITGMAFDSDFNSPLIPANEGATIDRVSIKITNSKGSTVFEVDILNEFMDYDELTGKYSFSHQWNTRETIEGFFKYSNDNYTITISALDTGGYRSEAWGTKNITVQLYHLISPIAIINKVNGELIAKDNRQEAFETKEKTLEVEFDGSESYDIDGNVSNLLFYWDFGDGEVEDWGSNPMIKHEFKIDTGEKINYFDVVLKVKDTDGLESRNKNSNEVEIRIDYTPPPGDPAGPLNEYYDLDLKSGSNLYLMLLVITVMNIVAALAMFLSLRKIQKQRQAQKALMEKQRRELEEEMARERAEAGYGDFSADYLVTPAAATPAAPPPAQPQKVAAAQQPKQVTAGQPVSQSAGQPAKPAAQLTAKPPAQQPQSQPPQQKPVTTATVTTPGSQAPAQQVQVQQGTPQPPPSVGQDATAGMASYQVRQCPGCGGTVTAGWTECPSCKAKL